MDYQREREQFLLAMQAEGMPPDVARLILRHANTIQRCAVLECSSEAADRDRVRCPGTEPNCLCRDYGSYDPKGTRHGKPAPHGTVPRIARTSARAEARIAALCAQVSNGKPFVPVFHGDPRGACVKLQVPSGKTDDWGREGMCVPTRTY